ncbi:MAG: HAD family hydrolase, partial [Rhodobacteraceae bacterium]|nr:HAD family hydrolase [Paracoccaceae bacterium]
MTDFVLVDLDGTLVDPAPGIIGSFRHALTTLGHPAPPAQDLGWIIGPPLRRSFERQIGAPDQVEDAVAHYREVYGVDGLFQATLYDGIVEALTGLKAAGYGMYLCTAKPIVFARRITAHFGLDTLFDGQYGADLDGRFDDKGDLIAHILAHEGLD